MKRDFDKEAANWDEHPVRVKLADDVAAAIIRQVPFKPEMELLDFGCGTGLLALKLADRVRSVTGVDTSRGMIDVLKKKIERLDLPHVEARLLDPDRDLPGAYDVIVSNMAFHHIEDTAATLARLFRALKTPGYLCIADLDPDQGEFHEDNTGVFHFGFDRAVLHTAFAQAGFSRVVETTAAEVTKPTRTGALRKFSLFLMTGRKSANG